MIGFLLWVSSLLAPHSIPLLECGSCHAQESAAHAKSRHAVAWTNPLFRAEYDAHPKSWCVGCHAAEVKPAEQVSPPAAIAERGVGCAGCHREGAAAASCESCHQFNFPVLDPDGEIVGATAVAMQNTVAEARAVDPDVTCTSCHDPHRAAGSHDLETLRAALALEVCQRGDELVATVTNIGAGHNLPTGGVHRYIAISVWRSSAPASLAELRLGRTFAKGPSATRVTVGDTTIPAGGSAELVVNLASLGGEAVEPINIEARYHYALRPGARLADGSPAQRSIERRRAVVAELPRCVDHAMTKKGPSVTVR